MTAGYGATISVEAAKGKEKDPPPEPPEDMQPCRPLDFSSARPSLDS